MITLAPPPPATALDAEALVRAVCLRVAPLWGLRDLVAVNPYLGHADAGLLAAEDAMQRSQHAAVLPSWEPLRRAWQAGKFALDDVAAARSEVGASAPPSERIVALLSADHLAPEPARCLSIAGALADRDGCDWVRVVVDDLGRFMAARADTGVARWTFPDAGGLWATWRCWMRHDRSFAAHGLPGVPAWIAALPDDAVEARRILLARVGLDSPAAEQYLGRLLGEIPGWAGWLRQEARTRDPDGTGELPELLTMRLALDLALHDLHPNSKARPLIPAARSTEVMDDRLARLTAVTAWERAVRHDLVRGFRPVPTAAVERAAVQAVFCIDVRSEGLRRHLESADPGIATFGFAGFFAMPLAVQGGEARAQCPVLLQPGFSVRLAQRTATPLGRLLGSFRRSAVGGFAYMETLGLGSALGLLRGSLGGDRPLASEDETAVLDDAQITPDQRLALLRGMLVNLGLARPYARLVLICGHDSSTANNAQGAALACGACGGHSGAINARLAARLYNDPALRLRLGADAPPQDSVAVAALHDTATDGVRILDQQSLPASHSDDLDRLRRALARAGDGQRARRAAGLQGISASASDGQRLAELEARSRDWAELRPEWGLAGTTAFIAAPRALTVGRDLGGRCFLHSYDESRDPDGAVLTLILTAPVVVASWINLQYWASTIDPERLGSGSKAIHSIAAGIGVIAGQSGDLGVGLALQSVHDGERPRHDPIRLQVFVATSPARMERVIAGHAHLADLVENGWIVLHAVEATSAACQRRLPGATWVAV